MVKIPLILLGRPSKNGCLVRCDGLIGLEGSICVRQLRLFSVRRLAQIEVLLPSFSIEMKLSHQPYSYL